MQPLLSILIPALAGRDRAALENNLRLQIASAAEPVELLIEEDAGQLSSGAKRQRLLERSTGQYIAYVDDDDQVASDYVDALQAGCLSGRDVVTLQLELTRSDRPSREVWTFGLWPNQRKLGRMQVNHLCAWRRDIARRVAWCPDLGNFDDHLWFQPLMAAGLVQSEWHIDRVLYHYQYSPAVTVNQSTARRRAAQRYFGRGIRCFRQQGEILIEVGGRRCHGCRTVRVRDRHNEVTTRPLDQLQHFHTVRWGL